MNPLAYDPLHDRGRALEDEYFHRVDQELIAKLHADAERETQRERLMRFTGLPDTDLIDDLMQQGITPESLAAMMYLPAVLVAWADGDVAAQERQVIVHEAIEHDLFQRQAAMDLLDQWLRKPPGRNMWSIWQAYAGAVLDQLGPRQAGELHERVHSLATRVAMAAGGMFGRGKITSGEQAILDEIAELR